MSAIESVDDLDDKDVTYAARRVASVMEAESTRFASQAVVGPSSPEVFCCVPLISKIMAQCKHNKDITYAASSDAP